MQPEPNLEQIINQGMNGAPQVPPEAMGMALGLIVVFLIFFTLVFFAVKAIICVFLSKPLKVVPDQYRLISPGMVWLWMIPIFDIIWSFFVFPKVSKSLKQFADSQGNNTVGDCGETLGWVYCGIIVANAVLSFIVPPLGNLLGIAALVLVIIYLVKVNSVAGQLRMAGMQQPTQASVAPPEQPFGE